MGKAEAGREAKVIVQGWDGGSMNQVCWACFRVRKFWVQITQLTKIGFKGINNHLFSQLFRPLKNIFSLFATYSSWFQVKAFLFTDNATEALSSANRKPFLICTGAKSLQCVWLFATLWIAACQVPLSMGLSRKDCWSGLPCPPQVISTQGSNPRL